MIPHPAAQYVAVGKIDCDQLVDYAKRRGTTAGELTRFLAKNIG
jgi:hypothetical protein